MFTGKTALVTGATSGIGLGIARHFAAQGANIILNGFGDSAEIEALRAELARTHGVHVRYQGADMGQQADIEAMMADVLAEFGCIDLLVNNAGIQHVAPVDEFPVDKWNAILAINLSATFHTSAHALVASKYKSAYVAAKHGVAGFTKTIALEVAEMGITMNAVCPGYVLTPLVEKQIPDTAKARGISNEEVIRDVLLAAQPTKKFVTVEQVAALSAFLCSDAAASITGAILPIEGGWTAQ